MHTHAHSPPHPQPHLRPWPGPRPHPQPQPHLHPTAHPRRARLRGSRALGLGIGLAIAAATAAPARATCGSATCFLVTGTQEGLASAGTFRADLSFRYIDQERKLSGSSETDTVLVPKVDFEGGVLIPAHHREERTRVTSLQLDLGYAATERLTLLAGIPLLIDKDHEHFDDAGGPDEHFVGTDGTRGFGDIALGARLGLLVAPKDLLTGDLALKVPTGAYRLLDSEGDINEPTIQPGSGSYDLLGAVHYAHHPFPSPFEWFLTGSYRVNGENNLDYRIGDEAILSAGVDHGSGGRLQWSVQVNARRSARDAFHGDDVPSTGSTYVNLTPGLGITSAAGTRLYGYVQIPVYQDVNEEQLAPSIGLVLGVSKTF